MTSTIDAPKKTSKSKVFIDVTAQGVSPLMVHALPETFFAKIDGDAGGKTGKPRKVLGGEELTPREQAQAATYMDAEGTYTLPPGALYRSIIGAGRLIKLGKRQLSTRDESMIPGFLWLRSGPAPVIITESDPPWEVDARAVTNQASKVKIPCYRPVFGDWQFKFQLEADTESIPVSTIRMLVDYAGGRIGIGVMRPARGYEYGRFEVTHWDIA